MSEGNHQSSKRVDGVTETSQNYRLTQTVVLVGLMGAGKSTVGRRLAEAMGVEFVDSDDEIETAAGMKIPDIFERFGEQYFRDGENRVIARLLRDAPRVLATGGGAFMSDINRDEISAHGASVWIKADLETLWERVQGKPGRPLLQHDDAKNTLSGLVENRYPTYAKADITVTSHHGQPHEKVVKSIVNALKDRGILTLKEPAT